MFQLVWCKDPINQSVVAYTSDNSQGVSESSLLFSSTKVSSLMFAHLTKSCLPIAFWTWSSILLTWLGRYQDPMGRVALWASLQTLVPPRGGYSGKWQELKYQHGAKAGPFVPQSTTLESTPDPL